MPQQPIPTDLFDRKIVGGARFARNQAAQRLQVLELSSTNTLESKHDGALTWLSLDYAEQRYLLASAADCSVAAYDTFSTSAATQYRNPCLFKIDRGTPDGHRFSISGVTWYPVDTGLFVTASFDKDIKVWDTNALQVACSFSLPSQVNVVTMSPCAVAHCLIAAGAGDPDIRLCDPNSGSLSHLLVGHRDKVWAAAWSLQSEWELVTGGCDGQVRLWDIRAAGSVHVFDQHDTQLSKRSSTGRNLASATAHHGVGQMSGSAATAHEGSVTAVLPSPDGLHWVTAGTDSRVRLWDSLSFRNKLVNFRQTANRSMKGRQLAIAEDARLLFHPSGSVIQGFDLLTGEQKFTLKGHMDAINACTFSEARQELYTGSNDRQICTWTSNSADRISRDEDTWSL